MDDGPVVEELRLATEAYRSGDLNAAERRIDALLASHPDRADVKFTKGLIVVARGNHAEGLEWLTGSLTAEPGNPAALAWAAFACLHLRRFEEAERYARASEEADPFNPRAPYLLTIALRGLSRIQEASDAIERSLSLNPNDSESLVTKARLLRERGMPALAVKTYRRAMAVRPTPSAAVVLARMLLEDSQPEEALGILQSLMPHLPEPARPYDAVAEAQTELQQFADAETSWSAAERFTRDRVALIHCRARAEIAAGRFEVAESLLAEVMDSGPRSGHSFFLLSTARKMRPEDVPLAKRMQAMLAKGELDEAQAAELNYGLGKAFDDIGDYEQAIRHYDEANRIGYELHLRGARYPFRPEDAVAYTDAQIAYFSKDRVRKLARDGLPSSLPVFVLGMPRSGTTLTSNVLTSHSRVGGGGEYSFWPEHVNEYLQWRAGHISFDADRAAELSEDYLRLLAPRDPESAHVVDKNPNNFQHSAMLHALFPNARILHLLRHPVDNILSMWMIRFSLEGGYLSKRENLVLTYREHMRLLRHFREVLPENRFATFRYEDLTSRPDPTIRQMLAYLDLDPEPACFAPEKNVRTVLTPSVLQVRQPIHRGSQARWRNYEPWLGVFAELLEETEAA